MEQRRLADAVSQFRRAVELRPGNARSQQMLAEALRQLNRGGDQQHGESE
jgi:Flp pilus assembly protein TadD